MAQIRTQPIQTGVRREEKLQSWSNVQEEGMRECPICMGFQVAYTIHLSLRAPDLSSSSILIPVGFSCVSRPILRLNFFKYVGEIVWTSFKI